MKVLIKNVLALYSALISRIFKDVLAFFHVISSDLRKSTKTYVYTFISDARFTKPNSIIDAIEDNIAAQIFDGEDESSAHGDALEDVGELDDDDVAIDEEDEVLSLSANDNTEE